MFRLNKSNKGFSVIELFLGIFILVGLGFAGWYVYRHHSNTVTKTVSLSAPVYYKVPKDLASLDLIKNTVPLFGLGDACFNQSTGATIAGCTTPLVQASKILYKQIGITAENNPIIVAWVPETSVTLSLYYQYLFFVKNSATNYTYYANMYEKMYPYDTKGSAYDTEINNTFSNNVSIDKTSILSIINFPNSATVNGNTYTLPESGNSSTGYFISSINQINNYYSNGPSVPSADISKIGTSGDVTFYDVTAQDSSFYQLHEIYAVIGSYATEYQPYDSMLTGTGDISLGPTSNITSLTPTQLTSTLPSCGNAGSYLIAKNIDTSTLSQVGTGTNSQTVYQLSIDNKLLNEIYDTDYQSSIESDAQYQNLTLNQLQADYGVLVVKNGLGQYQIYLRNDIFIGGGCGKPVIYLYPTHTESVNVSIGANINKSSPIYGTNGWFDIIAHPNGQLEYRNTPYSSLYWEGMGDGVYPAITEGTIVKSADKITVIKQQLKQQGLNNQEISDFLNFWAPKLPNTPYIRITWFDTQQLNQLAPLFISPKPETLIRVFLDFQGLDMPYSLPKQTFTSPTRIGFTVVEWGGILRNGLD